MSTQYAPSCYPTTSLPLHVSSKAPQPYYQTPRYAGSSHEVADSIASGSGMNSAYSATSASSYAGSSSGEYDASSSASANGVDLQEYMQDRFSGAFNPLPLDRSLATQAQT